MSERVLSQPLLYVSLYFKLHRDEYYDRLQAVRMGGDWEGWMAFYLKGIDYAATQAAETARKLVHLFERDHQAIIAGRGARSTLRVYEYMKKSAFCTVAIASDALGLSKPTVGQALDRLQTLGIAKETSGKLRDRTFLYANYVDTLSEGVGVVAE